ncbi:unnamed protein product [Ranitomeya imitator]|uniref:MADF domain-containing protein n=1 Tax=Ranitomeya imitator TaxID=111125 RepID=A0ABN9L607_9NEOB|nr:unnamed protein product [Ranitomeya imitator]
MFTLVTRGPRHRWSLESCLCDSSPATTLRFTYDHGQVISLVVIVGYHVYTDNYYTSIPLYKSLHAANTGACGTVRKNRVGFPSQLVSRRLERGASFSLASDQLLAVKWKGRKDVYMLTTLHADNTVTVRERGATRDKEKPVCATDYNKYMGGIDLSDQVLQPYLVKRKTRAWYKKIEQHPEVWDRSSEKYKGAKRDAWPKIVTALFPEWPNLPTQQQTQILGDVKTRWRSVTDRYLKSFKSPSGSSPPRKRVPYGDQLQFILGSRSLRRTESNVCAQTPPDLNDGDTTVDSIGEEVQDSIMDSQESPGNMSLSGRSPEITDSLGEHDIAAHTTTSTSSETLVQTLVAVCRGTWGWGLLLPPLVCDLASPVFPHWVRSRLRVLRLQCPSSSAVVGLSRRRHSAVRRRRHRVVFRVVDVVIRGGGGGAGGLRCVDF